MKLVNKWMNRRKNQVLLILKRYWVLLFLLTFLWVFMYELKAQKDEKTIKNQSYLIQASKQNPNIQWVKNKDFVLIDINNAFVKYLLEPNGLSREDCVGYTDFNIRDSTSALEYQKYDQKAIDCFCSTVQIIKAPYYGDSILFTAIKYPVIFENGDTGVAGDSKIEIIKSE